MEIKILKRREIFSLCGPKRWWWWWIFVQSGLTWLKMDMPAANHSKLDCLNHKNYFVSSCTLIVFLFIAPISVEMEKKELRSAARFIILNHLIRFLIVCLVYMLKNSAFLVITFLCWNKTEKCTQCKSGRWK